MTFANHVGYICQSGSQGSVYFNKSQKSQIQEILGNRHTRGSARTTNARERSTRGLTSEPVPSAIMTAVLQ